MAISSEMTGNEVIILLIDTGADISVFKRGKINPSQIINRTEVWKIKGVTDGITASIGTTQTKLYLDNHQVNHKFHVVDDDFPVFSNGILSRDFITKNQCHLDYANWAMAVKIGGWYNFTDILRPKRGHSNKSFEI